MKKLKSQIILKRSSGFEFKRITPFRARMTLLALFTLSAFFALLATCPAVFAQQLSLSIYPPHLETIIKSGKSILVGYTIQNLGDPVVIGANVLPFTPKEDGGIVIQEEFSGPVRFSLDNSNIQLAQPFFLNTKQSQQLLLRIRLPEGAPQGDYYYTFFVESEPPPSLEGRGPSTRSQARVGSNILITVTGNGVLDTKGKVTLFDVLPRFKLGNLRIFDTGDKIPVVLIVRNEGKNFVQTGGRIVLKGNFGEKATYDILPLNILADSQRVLAATPSAEVDCEGHRAVYCQRPVSLLVSGFFIGKYNLSADINFGEGTPIITASTTFLAIPIKFLLGLLLILVVARILIRKSRK